MTKRKLAAELCKREGKKSQVKMGDMMEVLSRLEDILAENAFKDGEETTIWARYDFFDAIRTNANNKLKKMWKAEAKKKGKR